MTDQLTKEILAFESDHIWIDENFDNLLKEYQYQWIGAKNHQVIASQLPFLSAVLAQARRQVARPILGEVK